MFTVRYRGRGRNKLEPILGIVRSVRKTQETEKDMKKTILYLIITTLLITAFAPMKKKKSLFDIAHGMLVSAIENRGEMQTYGWKKYTLYLQLEKNTDYDNRDVFKIGISQRGRYPGMKAFNLFRSQYPKGYLMIGGSNFYKERKGKNYFIWDEMVLYEDNQDY